MDVDRARGLMHADADLASRLEALTAHEMYRMAHAARTLFPERQALAIDVAGGVAAFVGEGSPINDAFGLGMTCEVSDEDIALLERFFEWRGARGKVGVCPFAHPSLALTLGERGWLPDGFENVLALPLDSASELPEPAVEVRLCTPEERDLWSRVVAVSFAAPSLPTQPELDLAHIVAARDEAQLYLAWVDGEAVGAGELVIEEGVGWLSADTTLPPYRGRGIQQSVQAVRLRVAREAGCDLAVTESMPGSGSQRNMERLGFRVLYTRLDMIAPWRVHTGGPDEAGSHPDVGGHVHERKA